MVRYKIKACVYDKAGRLIGQAENNYRKTHPIQAHFAKLAAQPSRIFLHAEIAALLRCGDKIPVTISISRLDAQGRPALAAPCAVCSLAIKHWKLKHVIHT